MADKVRKWKDDAAELLRKGKYAKALALFRKVVAVEPEDFSCHNNIGYILRKLGRGSEAAEVFTQLAEVYAERGFLLKAIANCKVVLEIDPSHTSIQKRLAELYAARSGPAETAPPPEAAAPPALKVMAETDMDAQVGDAGMAPLSDFSYDEVELPQAEGEAATLEIQRTTDLDDVHPGADDTQSPPAIMPVEIEAIPLDLPGTPPGAGPAAEAEPGLEAEPGIEPHAGAEPTTEVEPAAEAQPALEAEPAVGAEPAVEAKPAAVAEAADDAAPVAEDEPVGEAGPAIDVDLDMDIGALQAEEAPKEERTLPAIPLFSDLAPEAFVALLEQMEMVRMKPGDWILHEGEAGRSMFIVASGAVRVLKKLEGTKMLQLAVLGEGAFFGEMSVLRGGPRGASVQAVKPGELFEISRALLDQIIDQHPPVEDVLKKFTRQRLLRNVMNTSSLFRPFTREERVHILERFVSRDVKRGEVLIEEGELSNGFFVVLRGRMDVLLAMDDGSTKVVGELGEGEVFGEISNLYREPAVATVRAATPASILRLPRSDFQSLILSHPQILELVSGLGEQRKALTANALAKQGILI